MSNKSELTYEDLKSIEEKENGIIELGIKAYGNLWVNARICYCKPSGWYVWLDIVWMHKDNCETVRFPTASYTDILTFACAWAR